MTDATVLDANDPPEIEPTDVRCTVCGQPIHADLAGPEHDEPSDHEAVGPDDQ